VIEIMFKKVMFEINDEETQEQPTIKEQEV
jgi:hypothetical protein